MKDENITESSNRHTRTPSIRELMLGRTVIKKLPDNFYQKIFELETKLKNEFKLIILQELVNYYSNAIEYYESIEDPKYKELRENLNRILSDPEILMNINHVSKTGQPKKVNEKSKQAIRRIKTVLPFEDMKADNGKVCKLLVKESNNDNNLNSIMNNDIEKQNVQLKKKLSSKRTSKRISSLNLIDHDKKSSSNLIQKSFMSNDKNDSLIITQNTNDYSHSLDYSFEREIKDLDNVSEIIPSKSKFKSNKENIINEKIKTQMNALMNEYNSFFYEEMFNKLFDDMQSIMMEKHKVIIDIISNYNNQIKEYEFLLTSDVEGVYLESINKIIDQLNEERENEIKKAEEKFAEIIEKEKMSLKQKCSNNNGNNKLIEEKFRFDVLSNLNGLTKSK